MKVIDRIFQYFELNDIKPTVFEKKVGISNGYFGTQKKRKADVGETIISKIIENCQDININWLITGKGEMLKPEHPKSDKPSDVSLCEFCKLKDQLIRSHQDTIKSQQHIIDLQQEMLSKQCPDENECQKNERMAG